MMSAHESSAVSRKAFRRILLWLGALGLVPRLAYLSEHAGSAFFNVPILDEKYYDAVARALAEGGPVAAINPGFRPLLYPLFLSLWHRLAPEWGTVLAIVVQHLLGVATGLLVAVIAMRLFRRPSAGVWAGGLYLLAGPPLFFEGELLITSLFTFLATALLWTLSRADPAAPGAWRWSGAGLARRRPGDRGGGAGAAQRPRLARGLSALCRRLAPGTLRPALHALRSGARRRRVRPALV